MTYILVFYDVSDDRRRLVLAERLKALGLTRIQRSVFMGRGGHAKAKDVARIARMIVDPRTDSVVVVVVPADYARRIMVVGQLWDNPYRDNIVVV